MHPQIIQLTAHQNPEEVVKLILTKNGTSEYTLMTIMPSGSSITIDQIRELRREIQMLGSYDRVIAFYSFEKATLEAQNAMLKVLEELSTKHFFLLFTTNIDSLLPTIRSRCSLNRTYEIREEVKTETYISETITAIRNGKGAAEMAKSHMQPSSLDDARTLLKQIISELRPLARSGDSWSQISIKKALELLSLSESNNLNAQLSVDLWMLDAISRT